MGLTQGNTGVAGAVIHKTEIGDRGDGCMQWYPRFKSACCMQPAPGETGGLGKEA